MENPEELLAGKRILVTGGAGFIGSNLVSELVRIGSEITVLDDLFTGSHRNLDGLDKSVEFVRGSVTDRDLVNILVAKSDLVFHLAARNIIASTREPYEDFQTNIGGTLNVLMAARACRIDRVVYASSASIYGNATKLPIAEDSAPSLLTPYAVSKFAGEGYCRAFFESYGVPFVALRYSNVYGPRQRPENPYCGVVAKFMNRAEDDLPAEVFGDGLQTRDFTFVGDCLAATLLAATSPKSIGQVFNIATGIETTITDLAILVAKLCSVVREPIFADGRDIDNIRRRVLNINKIENVLNWRPSVSLNKGLLTTRQWLKETKNLAITI